jgi:hypothetical protein
LPTENWWLGRPARGGGGGGSDVISEICNRAADIDVAEPLSATATEDCVVVRIVATLLPSSLTDVSGQGQTAVGIHTLASFCCWLRLTRGACSDGGQSVLTAGVR